MFQSLERLARRVRIRTQAVDKTDLGGLAHPFEARAAEAGFAGQPRLRLNTTIGAGRGRFRIGEQNRQQHRQVGGPGSSIRTPPTALTKQSWS